MCLRQCLTFHPRGLQIVLLKQSKFSVPSVGPRISQKSFVYSIATGETMRAGEGTEKSKNLKRSNTSLIYFKVDLPAVLDSESLCNSNYAIPIDYMVRL